MRRLSRRGSVIVVLLALASLAASLPARADAQSSYSNLPLNLSVGDIDGDGFADLLQVAGNRLFVSKANFAGTGILHHYFSAPVRRLVVGDFSKTGRARDGDEVCAVLENGGMDCYAFGERGDDGFEHLWWWFSQPAFIASEDRPVVGDFDGNGLDDILVHRPSNGSVRLYAPGSSYFDRMSRFSTGNLGDADLRNKQIWAGEFGQAAGRDDLLVVNTGSGFVSRYDSATNPDGTRTFWWAFDADASIDGGDEISIANVDGGSRDEIVIRDTSSGSYRFRNAEYGGGNLSAVRNVSAGQLPVTGQRSRAIFTRLKSVPSETGGTTRDDVLFVTERSRLLQRIEARHDGSRNTYWWAFDRTLGDNSGWPGMDHDTWLVIDCRFKNKRARDGSLLPTVSRSELNRLFMASGVGQGGMVDYFSEISYGRVDISPSVMTATRIDRNWWSKGPPDDDGNYYTPEIDPALPGDEDGRSVLARECLESSGKDRDDYKAILVVMNAESGFGGSKGETILTPSSAHVALAGQEMLHGYDLRVHSKDRKGKVYGDPWDIMSTMTSAMTFQDAQNRPSGPELNAAFKQHMKYLPASRTAIIAANSGKQTVTLAALNRPEANGALVAQASLGDGKRLTVEYREATGFDRGIGGPAVVIHRWAEDTTWLQTSQTTPGQSYSHSEGNNRNVTVRLVSVNTAESTATVEITHRSS